MSVRTVSLLVLTLAFSFGCKNNNATATSGASDKVPADNSAVAPEGLAPVKAVEAKPQTHIATALPSSARAQPAAEDEDEAAAEDTTAELDSPSAGAQEQAADYGSDSADDQPEAEEDDSHAVAEEDDSDVQEEELPLDDGDEGAELDGELDGELDDE